MNQDRHGHGDGSDVDRAIDRLTKEIEGSFARVIAEIHRHQVKGFATERTQTALLNSLEAIRKEITANSLILAKVYDFLVRPEIVMNPGEPKDKE